MSTKALSLIQRDSFFDDSFFEDDWSGFDQALEQVLNKFHTEKVQVTKTNRSNCTDVYRKIRTTNIEKDLYQSQALQVTEQDGKFQCVMDVKDFNPNNLQVKVVDDRVVVEGKFEHKSEDGTTMTSKSFHKEFTLPSAANLELVATALSKDGVLTIKAPKKVEAITAAGSAPKGNAQQNTKTSSTVEESSSTTVSTAPQGGSSSVVEESSKKTSTSTSSFSSTKKTSSTTSTSTTSSSNLQQSSLLSESDNVAKDMQDRLVFTHDSVNIKLPENK